MRILVTGAAGFIGRRLVERLTATGKIGEGLAPWQSLSLIDLGFDAPADQPGIRQVSGSIADPRAVTEAVRGGVDVLFHLASVPGRWAEAEYERGRQVNLYGTIALLDAMRAQERPPIVVFASSAAVFGTPLPVRVDDDTVPLPTLSYGAQKLMGEVLVNDYSRRGWIDGRSVRLSGILVRPRAPAGLISAFLSDVMHAAKAGEPFTLPMSAAATTWVMSVPRCVDNLLHAARLAPGTLERRAFMLPALRLSMADIVNGLAALYGTAARDRIAYAPDPLIEAQFGRQPALETALADRLGFRHDGTAQALIERAMAA